MVGQADIIRGPSLQPASAQRKIACQWVGLQRQEPSPGDLDMPLQTGLSCKLWGWNKVDCSSRLGK